jgi:lipoyl(octanoyl) transferase
VLQTAVVGRVRAAVGNDAVMFALEHEPVFTLGRRADRGNILVSDGILSERGIEVRQTDRGGDVTYHGPGQLVCYPVFPIGRLRIALKRFVACIEESVCATLCRFGIRAGRVEGRVGVWLTEGACEKKSITVRRKICSIGMHVTGGVTYHGLALNVSCDLSPFKLMNPCGLQDVEMVSMEGVLGRSVSCGEVLPVLADELAVLTGMSGVRSETCATPESRLKLLEGCPRG